LRYRRNTLASFDQLHGMTDLFPRQSQRTPDHDTALARRLQSGLRPFHDQHFSQTGSEGFPPLSPAST
jgi:hypothetical protein